MEVLELPADIGAASRFSDWRRKIWWPIPIAEGNAIARDQARRGLAWVGQCDAGLMRDAALLALPTVLAYGRAILMAAIAVDRAAKERIRLVADAAEFEFLRSGAGDIPDRSGSILASEPIRHEFARRVARVRSWSGLTRTIQAFLSPDALAVSHNTLLRKAAAASPNAIGFRHADSILAEARRVSGRGEGLDIAAMAEQLSDVLIGRDILAEPYRSRAMQLCKPMALAHLTKAAADISALRSVRLPDEIWSGSGGLHAPRAIGLEVMRRGGKVVRFDHGKPKAFVHGSEIDAVVEYSSSSKFMVATKGVTDLVRRHSDLDVVGWRPRVELGGLDGDPTFASVPIAGTNRNKSGRLRLVYAPTQLLGFRQLLPVQQHDLVYLQWQMEVVEMLRALPIDLVCQAHPEGLFGGKPHPLEGLVDVRRGGFEEQLGQADVFIFDYPSTTTMWQAACTDAKVIYLDMGSGVMTPEVAELFARRSTILPVAFDDGNRPLLDAAALRDAVLTQDGPADPMPLRRLLAGDA
jgi:hypothetical protein